MRKTPYAGTIEGTEKEVIVVTTSHGQALVRVEICLRELATEILRDETATFVVSLRTRPMKDDAIVISKSTPVDFVEGAVRKRLPFGQFLARHALPEAHVIDVAEVWLYPATDQRPSGKVKILGSLRTAGPIDVTLPELKTAPLRTRKGRR
jgi:hypothetical protein